MGKKVKKKLPLKGLQPKKFDPEFDDRNHHFPDDIGQRSLVTWVRANCKFASFGFEYDPSVTEKFEQRWNDLKQKAGNASILMLRTPSGTKYIVHPTSYEGHQGQLQVSELNANGVPEGHSYEFSMDEALRTLATIDGIEIIDKRQGPKIEFPSRMAWVRANCKFAMDLNGDSWVSPDGKFYPADGGHPNWAHDNYKQFGIQFNPTRDLHYEPATDPSEAYMDENEQIALDHFKDAGWLRIKYGSGIEGYISPRNINLIKRIYREMAKWNGGRSMYFDDGDGSIQITVLPTGRLDFSQLDERAMRYA